MVYIKLNGFEMKFICFYTKNSVCAVKPITAEEIANADTEYKTLELFNSVVFTKECDDFLLEVQRDGQLRFHSKVVELNHPKDEYFLFERSVNWHEKWFRYLELINAFHLILYSSVIQFKWGGNYSIDFMGFYDVTRNDAFLDDTLWGGAAYYSNNNSGQNRRIQYRQFQIPFSLREQSIGLDAIILTDAVNEFSKISKNHKVISLLAEMAKSLAEYKQFNNTASLIFSWFGTEKILLSMWNELRSSSSFSQYKFAIDERNKHEKHGVVAFKNYNTFHIINGLCVAERVSVDDCNNLHTIRKSRNKVAHSEHNKISEYDAELCLKLFVKLMNGLYNMNISLNFSYTTEVI